MMRWTSRTSSVDKNDESNSSSSYDDASFEDSEESDISSDSYDSNVSNVVNISKSLQSPRAGLHSVNSSSQRASSKSSFSKLRKFELYSTAQCYYLIASDKTKTEFRVLKMDRTLIEQQQDTALHNAPTGRADSIPSFPLLYVLPPPPPPPPRPLPSPKSYASSTSDNASVVSADLASTAPPSHSTALEEPHSLKPTLRPLVDFCFEDPVVYSAAAVRDMLDMIQDGNKCALPLPSTNTNSTTLVRPNAGGDGALRPLIQACGIVGFIRFLDCYYLTFITEKVKVGNIGGNDIYTIKNTETFAIKPVDRDGAGGGVLEDPSSLLLNMWNRGKRSLNLGLSNRELAELRYQQLFQVIDLTKDFFYSYTYDLTRSLQENMAAMTQPSSYNPPNFKDMYCWNFYLTRELEKITGTSSPWVLPIIHGAFLQRKIIHGRTLNLILLARRSRHFAGTRYLKRGVSDRGKVANDVEHEQILHDESSRVGLGTFSSYLQVRGSIPTFWTQETSVTMPKPPIVLNRVDPNYTSTQNHFGDLFQRYGSPVVVVDLVKQSERREREVIVGNEFRHAIEYLNSFIDEEHKIRYCALDYSHVSKNRNLNVSLALQEVACWAVNLTGFFCSDPRWKLTKKDCIEPMEEENSTSSSQHISTSTHHGNYHQYPPIYQMGVMRTNCIDCLDRTNVAQFSAGVEALSQQLVVMGICSLSTNLDPTSNVVKALIDMYVEIGDHISLQYGGSEAHKKVQSTGASVAIQGPAAAKHKELLTSIRRYYSNAFTDRLKQDAMNLFLGYYIPSQHFIPLWELENDYYLHNLHVKTGKESVASLNLFHENFSVDWNDDYEVKHSFENQGPTTESFNITRVRNQCDLERNFRSSWWKKALQSYMAQKQRFRIASCLSLKNIRDVPSQEDTSLSLTDFDLILHKTFELPMRLPHSSQNAITEDNKEQLHLHRYLSRIPPTKCAGSVETFTTKGISLGELLNERLFDRKQNPHLEQFLDSRPPNRKNLSALSLEEKMREWKGILAESTLESDNVDGILRLSQSAHIGQEIRSGPYCGVPCKESAKNVSSVINQQLYFLESLKQKGELRGSSGLPGVDEFLKRRGMDTKGVMDAIFGSWDRFSKSEQIYCEISEQVSHGSKRSDFTDEASLKTYVSHFQYHTQMSNLDLTLLLGQTSLDSSCTNDVDPAVSIKVNRVYPNISLFMSDTKPEKIPLGFEQINDDLYARTDNKFLVFNAAGLCDWPPVPITKINNR